MTYTIGIDPSSKMLAAFVLREGRAIHAEWRPLPVDKVQASFKAMMYVQMLCKKWGIKADAIGTTLDFAIEEPVVGKGGPYATIVQSKIHGACVAGAVASGRCANIYPVQNTTWKKEVIGKGNFPKASIGSWLESNWNKAFQLSKIPDHYDAACIAQYAHGLTTGKYKPVVTTHKGGRKKNG